MTPIDLTDESKDPYADARRTETCMAPSQVDASRDFYIFFPARGGGGGGEECAARLFFFSHVKQTTSGIGHRVK